MIWGHFFEKIFLNLNTPKHQTSNIKHQNRRNIHVKTSTMLKSLACLAVAAMALLAPCTAEAVTVYKPTASIRYQDYVYVSWKADSRATAFRVYRSTTPNYNNAVRIGTYSRSTRAVRDWTAKLGVKYYYWVASKVGSTFYYGSKRYDYGYRKYTLTWNTVRSGKTSSGGDKLWLWAKVNGSCLNNSGMSWSLTWSGVHSWYKYRPSCYLGYFFSNRRGKGYYTLKTGKNVTAKGSRTLTWY